MTAAPKNQVVRPNRGSSLRPRAEAPRRNFFYVDVTKEEQAKIHQYCLENQISVSQFFADLVLQDAAKPKPKHQKKVMVRAEFELTPDEHEKLELLMRLHQKSSIGQLVRDLIQPSLEVQRVHATLETTPLRYYLSEEEHETVTKHIASKGIAARNYGVVLALKAIDKAHKKQK